jgi:hypothetical protein
MTDSIFDQVMPLNDHGSAHLTITELGIWLALNGKSTQLRSGPHGDDLTDLALLLTQGMTARRRVAAGREVVDLGID